MSLEPHTTLAHYRIVEKIGEGGMGVVYRAFDEKLRREVALKVLRTEMAEDPERLGRFQQEARALAALNHPNIGAIHEIDEDGGLTFIVMEMIQGQTLRRRIGGRPVPLHDLLDLALQIADALDAAHSRGIIHRDIKPSNLLVTDRGQIKMLDFGLAKLTAAGDTSGDGASHLETAVADDRHVTTPGTTMGTIAYMSPEQVRGEELDARSDLFSFGVVLYEMATGKGPFIGATSGLTFDAILNRSPAPSDEINPAIPARLAQAIDRALEKDRRLRYQSAADMRADLARVRRDSDSGRVAVDTGSSRARPAARPAPKRTRRGRLWLAGILALAGVAVGAAVALRVRLPGLSQGTRGVIDSIAVLPFEYAGDDADGQYLSDGVTEALINGLSKVPSLRVVPRSLVFPYKGRPFDPRKIGRDLNVGAVVTGRVTQRGDDLSIATELIDAGSVAQIWGQQYSRPAAEAFRVPEEIAMDISQRLRPQLTEEVERRIARRYTDDPDAFVEYVKSLHQVKRGTRAEFDKAIASAQKAIVEDLRQRAQEPAPGSAAAAGGAGASRGHAGTKDPGFALAYTAIARLYNQQAYFGHHPSEEAHTKARDAAQWALGMDSTLAEAHGALAFASFFYEWDWDTAKSRFERALQLAPEDDLTRRDHAWYLMAMGRKDDAIREMRRACELNPGSEVFSAQLAELLFWARRDDEALAELERTRRMAEDSPYAELVTSGIRSRQGRHPEAIASYLDYLSLVDEETLTSPSLAYLYAAAGKRAEALEMLEKAAPGEISAAQTGWTYAALGDRDQAFRWLNKAIDQRDANMLWIRAQPTFDPLRADPRFAGLLRRMGLAP